MKELFPLMADFSAFLVDYLPNIGRRVGSGMDRITVENLVLESVPAEELEALLQAQATPATASSPMGQRAAEATSVRSSAESAPLPRGGTPPPDDTTLTGARLERFVKALMKAYPNKNSLSRMLDYQLEMQLDELALGEDLEDLAFKLVKRANAAGWTPKLISAAIAGQPKNPALLAFFQDRPPISASASLLHQQALEAILGGGDGDFVDVPAWMRRMESIVSQVCRIEVPEALSGGSVGTGFLVGPDLVLTNYHVVAALLRGAAQPGAVRVVFDYFMAGQGFGVGLAANYLLADSPMSPVDNELQKSRLPTDSELDFALLRLSTPVASQPRNGGSQARGYLSLISGTARAEDQRPLFIVQHPQGQPLKMHVDISRGYNGNGTRLTYTTNTQAGSSGSPCFDAQLRLVALHHSRDPSMQPTYNEGIPIEKVAAAIAQKGVTLPG